MSTFPVFDSPPVEIRVDGGTVSNFGDVAVYYRDDSSVSSTVNDGALAPGASVVLGGSQWVVTAKGTRSVVNLAAALPAEAGGGGVADDDPRLVKTYVWDVDEEEYVLVDEPVRAFVGPVDPLDEGFTMRAGDMWDPTEAEE